MDVRVGAEDDPGYHDPTDRASATSMTFGAVLPVLILAILLLIGLVAAACSTDSAALPTESPPATYVTVDVTQTYEALRTNEAAQIVDVREPGEWATTGVPPGAALIPLGQLEQRAPGELAQDKPVYVICNSGNRSRTGSEILLELGFTEVYNVGGGIQAWLQAGLPVEAFEPEISEP